MIISEKDERIKEYTHLPKKINGQAFKNLYFFKKQQVFLFTMFSFRVTLYLKTREVIERNFFAACIF